MGQVLVLGLISGGIYALFALGVVLVHRGTGVLTFANGEVGHRLRCSSAAVLRHSDLELPWIVGGARRPSRWPSRSAAVPAARRAPDGGSDPVAIAVATVGSRCSCWRWSSSIFGESPKTLDGPVDGGWTIAGRDRDADADRRLVLALALGSACRRSAPHRLRPRHPRRGAGPGGGRLVGVPLSRISLTIWGAGAAARRSPRCSSRRPSASSVPATPASCTSSGLAAAVIGGLSSLPGAFVGGIALGIAESAASRYLGDNDIPGLRYIVVLVVLLSVLLGRQYLPDLLRRLEPPAPADTTRTPAGASA
jgi:hypothetical protein